MALVTDDEASVAAARSGTIPRAFRGFWIIKDDDDGYRFSHSITDIDDTPVSLKNAVAHHLRTGRLFNMTLNAFAFCRKWQETGEVYWVHGIPFPVKIDIGPITPPPNVY